MAIRDNLLESVADRIQYLLANQDFHLLFYFSRIVNNCYMYYKLVEKFDSHSGKKWQDYLNWRGLNLTSFDSVDGILRPNLFEPESKEDWSNCVNENCKLNLLTNLDYAIAILNRYHNAMVVGVDIELQREYQVKEGLLGFDIIDSYCDVSLVTNWGTDEEGIINQYVMNNGLIEDLAKAIQIRDLLRKKFPEDSHAQNCHVWAVYKVDANKISSRDSH